MRKHQNVPIVKVDLHQHNMDQFLRCPYKYYLANVLKYRPRVLKKALNIGDLFAQCVYFLHKGEGIATCMAYVEKIQKPLMEKATSQEQIDTLETSIRIVQSMLFGYETRFLSKDKIKVTRYNKEGGIDGFDEIKIQKITPEYKLGIPIVVGNYHFNYINRLDGRITTEKNPWILEIKTTTLIDGNLLKKLNTNFQINSYWYAMLFNDEQKIDGVLYRYIRKPSIKQNKNETLDKFRIRMSKDYQQRPEFYFHEESLCFNHQILPFVKDLHSHFEELTRCYVTGIWTKKGTACDANFGLCEYLRYCGNPTEQALKTYYEKEVIL